MSETVAARFEAQRPSLFRHAYRMLGERADAEDAVQDAFVRFAAAAPEAAIDDDRAFLRTTVTRLCIDRLRSARARREVYVGPWLPEPLVERAIDDPQEVVTLADDVSFALLLALERLSALERAAFLLHDVMDVPFAEIAATLGRSEDAVKALASRARAHVRIARPRKATDVALAARTRARFMQAIADGDLTALQRVLADDVVLVADSNGKAVSAMVPVRGSDRVGRFFLGVARKAPAGMQVELTNVNGLPGFVLFEAGDVFQTTALEIKDERVRAIYVTRNPEKLARVARAKA